MQFKFNNYYFCLFLQEASQQILHQKIRIENNYALLWIVLLGIKSIVLRYCIATELKKVLILYFHEILQTRQLKLPRKSLKVDHRCQPKSLSEKSTYSPCFHISLFLRTSLRKSKEKKIELVVRPDFQGVVLPQPDPGVFPHDEVPG